MGAGIPGMGIASIFYVICALLAPFREIIPTLRGRSSRHKWRAIWRQFIMAWCIIAAVVGLYVGIDVGIRRGYINGGVGPQPLGNTPNFLFALFAMMGVLIFASLFAFWVGFRRYESVRLIAEDHRDSVKVSSRGVRGTKVRPQIPPATVPANQLAFDASSISYHQ